MTQDSFQTDLVVTRTEFDGCREVQLGVGHVCYFTTRAPGKDSANEDSLALVRVDSGRGVLAIADGFGGQPAGDQASELAVKTVASRGRFRIPPGASLPWRRRQRDAAY